MSDPSAGSPPAVSTNVRASSFASRYAYPSCIWVQTSVIVCHKGWNLPVSEPGSVPCHPMRSNANFFLSLFFGIDQGWIHIEPNPVPCGFVRARPEGSCPRDLCSLCVPNTLSPAVLVIYARSRTRCLMGSLSVTVTCFLQIWFSCRLLAFRNGVPGTHSCFRDVTLRPPLAVRLPKTNCRQAHPWPILLIRVVLVPCC